MVTRLLHVRIGTLCARSDRRTKWQREWELEHYEVSDGSEGYGSDPQADAEAGEEHSYPRPPRMHSEEVCSIISMLASLPGGQAMTTGAIVSTMEFFLQRRIALAVSPFLRLPGAQQMSAETVCKLMAMAAACSEIDGPVDARLYELGRCGGSQ